MVNDCRLRRKKCVNECNRCDISTSTYLVSQKNFCAVIPWLIITNIVTAYAIVRKTSRRQYRRAFVPILNTYSLLFESYITDLSNSQADCRTEVARAVTQVM